MYISQENRDSGIDRDLTGIEFCNSFIPQHPAPEGEGYPAPIALPNAAIALPNAKSLIPFTRTRGEGI